MDQGIALEQINTSFLQSRSFKTGCFPRPDGAHRQFYQYIWADNVKAEKASGLGERVEKGAKESV